VYARLAGASPPVIVRGENPAGLREKIRRAERTSERGSSITTAVTITLRPVSGQLTLQHPA
jgi:hypothetical protein